VARRHKALPGSKVIEVQQMVGHAAS
jgi:hypothetical protein